MTLRTYLAFINYSLSVRVKTVLLLEVILVLCLTETSVAGHCLSPEKNHRMQLCRKHFDVH